MVRIAPVRKNTAQSDGIYSGPRTEAGDLIDNLCCLLDDASGGIHWNERHIRGDGTDGR